MTLHRLIIFVLNLLPVFYASAYYPYIEIYSEPENRYIRHIDVDDNSSVKVTTSTEIIVFDERYEISHRYKADEKPDNNSKRSFRDSRGNIWYFDKLRHGIFFNGNPIDTLAGELVTAITSSADGSVFVGTNHNGIFVLDSLQHLCGHLTYSARQPNSLPTNHISALACDSANNLIWVGTSKGNIGILNTAALDTEFGQLSTEDDISAFASLNGQLFVATDGGGLHNISTCSVSDSIKAITGLLSYDNSLLASTYGNGIYHFTNELTPSRFRNCSEGSAVSQARHMIMTADSTLWVGTFSRGLVAVLPDSTFSEYNISNSDITSNCVVGMGIADNKIYVACSHGLNILDPVSKKLSRVPSCEQTEFRGLHTTVKGKVWLLTTDAVMSLSGERYELNDTPQAITGDSNGDIWVTTGNNLYYISNPAEPDGIYKYSRHDGLLPDRFTRFAIKLLPDSSIAIGGRGSYMILRPGVTATKPFGISEIQKSESGGLPLAAYIAAAIIALLAMPLALRLRNARKSNNAAQPAVAPNSDGNTQKSNLLSRAVQIIKANIDDPDFGVENLGRELNMSRSNLYRKLMAEADISPLELIRNIRIEEAHRLLISRELNISECAWKVGLSPKQFSKYFKQKYGVTPSEYISDDKA